MAGERTVPILPVPDLDDAIGFYEAAGFRRTFRQLRPNPYAVVEREDLALHLVGIDGFDPSTSVVSVIVVVADLAEVHGWFAAAFRARYGRLAGDGTARLTSIRRKAGTATGFTMVDPGGTWLRFTGAGATDEPERAVDGLARVLEVAARQGDARGDVEQAIAVLDAGLTRYGETADPEVVAEAQAYRAELVERRK